MRTRALFAPCAILVAITLLGAPQSSLAEQSVRVATYNVKFLSTGVAQQGDRLDKLLRVIELLEADVIGLQEIADRAALELLFPRDYPQFCAWGHCDGKERSITWRSTKSFWTSFWPGVILRMFSARRVCLTS